MFGGESDPILVLSPNSKPESGLKVTLENIHAVKQTFDVVRTYLNPQAPIRILMGTMCRNMIIKDGYVIIPEITVQDSAAESMIEIIARIEIAHIQDELVGDVTAFVIVLASEILLGIEHFLEQQMHPTVIIRQLRQGLEDMVTYLKGPLSIPIDRNDKAALADVIKAYCFGTKCISRWSDLAVNIALDTVDTVILEENGTTEVDIKRYVKVEKIPGGAPEDSQILKGVMVNKDVTHAEMRRYIQNPRIILLDCSLEYNKGEFQTNVEGESDLMRQLELERIARAHWHVRRQCDKIIALKPDVVFTEKEISDLAQHFLLKANISAISRVRKSDNNRIARACGATVVNCTEKLQESDIGTGAGLFEMKKLGDEYFCFITECKNSKACTIILRGASKDILNESERDLQDALQAARSIVLLPRVVPGGGAIEMAVAQRLLQKATHGAYRALAQAFESIPEAIAQSCGADTIPTLTALRAKHANHQDPNTPCTWGIDWETGELVDQSKNKLWEPLAVKLQTCKAAVETAIVMLRIDDSWVGVQEEPAIPAESIIRNL